jgi:hypothetical protein
MFTPDTRRVFASQVSSPNFARAFLPVGLALLAVGCQPAKNTISQIDPYVGNRPAPISALPEREVPEPAPTVKRPDSSMMAGWNPPGGISNRWKCIVIHHSDSDKSTPEGMRAWHLQRGWDALGYHFVIGNGVGYPDGKVFVGERWSRQMHGAHCKTPGNHYNEHGIGVCLIGNLDTHAPTSKQMQALTRLATFLSSRCGIPTSKILTHGGVTRKTACPGRCFNLSSLLREMSGVSLGEIDE